MDTKTILSSVFAGILGTGLGLFGQASSASADTVKMMAVSTCSLKEPGHVAFAFYDSRGNLTGTAGMWEAWRDNSGVVRRGVIPNQTYDQNLANGRVTGCGTLITRSANVSKSRREWIQNQVATAGGTNCTSYISIGGSLLGLRPGQCSCVNFGTRVWRQVTADRERWLGGITPTYVFNQIAYANGWNWRTGSWNGSGWFDNARQWN